MLENLIQKMDIRAVEVLFDSEDSFTISEKFVNNLQSRGIKIFVNALTYGGKTHLNAGHGDNESLLDDPGKGWGWLVKHGADIIQPDWVTECSQYLRSIWKK